jgi:hypothetical protein
MRRSRKAHSAPGTHLPIHAHIPVALIGIEIHTLVSSSFWARCSRKSRVGAITHRATALSLQKSESLIERITSALRNVSRFKKSIENTYLAFSARLSCHSDPVRTIAGTVMIPASDLFRSWARCSRHDVCKKSNRGSGGIFGVKCRQIGFSE